MGYHIFNTRIAKEYGIEEAIILENIYHWCEKNKANGHLTEGKPWTFNSVRAFNELFDYIAPSKISRALKKLEENGLIITGCFNKTAYDRTKWYCITEKAESYFETKDSSKCDIPFGKMKNGNDNMQNGFEQNDKPIPYINTDVNTDVNHIYGDKPHEEKRTVFVKPTVDEVKAYCLERNNNIDAQYFCDYYESKGWMIGKNKMKDWKCSVRTWERNNFNAGRSTTFVNNKRPALANQVTEEDINF